MKILFLTDDREDFLADSILHGLITLGDHQIIDYPQKYLLYSESFPTRRRSMIHGNGFTLYGLLANREVDRTLIWKRLEQGEFDIIFIGNIWRQFGQFSQVAKSISRCPRPTKLAILDGDDDPRLFPYSAARIRNFGTCANHLGKLGNTELFYFKRELNLDE